MIRREEEGLHRNPKGEIEAWLKGMSEADAKGRRYQEMAAEGLIEFGELRERLQENEIADREIRNLREKSECIQKMRRNKDALLGRLAKITPSRIDEIGSVERHKIYRMLGLKVVTNKDGTLTATGELV